MPLEAVETCPVCQSRAFSPFLVCTDHLVSHNTFTLTRCQQCQLVITSPRPTEATIGQYYQSEEYISHDDTNKSLIDRVYRLIRRFTLHQKQVLIERLNGGRGQLLDYGCGAGAFLQACQRRSWSVQGIEPDADARQLAASRLGQSVLKNVNEVTATQPFDVVTMWHVLEHVADLNQTLTTLAGHIRSGGVLVVAVPNHLSWDATHYQAHWAAYDVPRHLYHFTPSNLQQLMHQHGFQQAEQLPMWFDAYYISLLSSKLRSGRTRYIEAVLNGTTSNLKALKSGQFSSLTYVFRKR